ncbi:MAG: hypothetical protein JWM10_4272 [Myxococcaceae bacterium]|nr:hypothetical protein [Myxococcaceae bacterium]
MRAALGFALCLAAGCASVANGSGGTTTSTGDVWYSVHTTSIFGTSSGPIFYCPAPTAPGPVTCREPTIDEPVTGVLAPASPAAPAACSSLSVDAQTPAVTETTVATPLPPAAPEVVADGTYLLSAYEWHVPGAHDATRRTLVRIEGTHLEMVFSRNGEPSTALSGTVRFGPDGTMAIVVSCPRAGNLEFDHYAVVPNGLVLISATQGKSAVFSRMP